MYFRFNVLYVSVIFGWGRIWTFRPGFRFEQRYHVDRHGELALKQLRLSVLNEMHTNSYTGPRLPLGNQSGSSIWVTDLELQTRKNKMHYASNNGKLSRI